MYLEEKDTGLSNQWRARERRKRRRSACLTLQYSVTGGDGAITRSSIGEEEEPALN